ncbi:uncharacterized protein B0P05DRAFT_549772 [Gilbertella persicaria]|uniref:Uncharacterized protein n=1 Tax=Rhizopus stolonifer TaxID=4846 RepID=A0A367J096_RHIST|nr:uncharacterized protein B0P05DRAFT_549772 [Gilbertella persicaria]KAI8071147.1 hypothetical protein B0P05DRAFT_549772 [Gilbertella persicaria]RCH83368.1 hypothetical protein CU098_005691 [Rhizopus stolonifer]
MTRGATSPDSISTTVDSIATHSGPEVHPSSSSSQSNNSPVASRTRSKMSRAGSNTTDTNSTEWEFPETPLETKTNLNRFDQIVEQFAVNLNDKIPESKYTNVTPMVKHSRLDPKNTEPSLLRLLPTERKRLSDHTPLKKKGIVRSYNYAHCAAAHKRNNKKLTSRDYTGLDGSFSVLFIEKETKDQLKRNYRTLIESSSKSTAFFKNVSGRTSFSPKSLNSEMSSGSVEDDLPVFSPKPTYDYPEDFSVGFQDNEKMKETVVLVEKEANAKEEQDNLEIVEQETVETVEQEIIKTIE